VKPSPGPEFDGINLLPYLASGGRPLPRRNRYWRMFGGDYMAVRDPRYKLVRSKDGPDELYDLSADAPETQNLATSKPAEAKRLGADLERWHRAMAKPAWLD
jgi:arylsulfatase A-like enzyme